jgi:hypothetical protein
MNKLLRGVLSIAAFTGTLAGGTAHAAFYTSHFDPPGDVQFSGVGTFFVDDACLAAGTGFFQGDECHAQLLGANLDLIMNTTPGTGHVAFGSSTDIDSVVIEGGELVGVNTGLIGSAFADPCTGAACGMPWWVQWQDSSFDPVFLYTGSCDGECVPNLETVGIAFNVSFERIPEPGSLALLGAGLLGVIGVRRRRAAR